MGRRRVLGALLFGGSLWLLGCQDFKKKREKDFTLSSPNEAPTSGVEAARHHFITTPAKVLPQYFMRSEWRAPSTRPSNKRRHSRGVVPIVDESWREGDPIPLWASGAWLNYPLDGGDALLPKRQVTAARAHAGPQATRARGAPRT